MKTLREILFERHRKIDCQLEEVRREAISALVAASSHEHAAYSWQEWLAWFGPGYLRWHLACLAAVWLLTVILSVAGSASTRAISVVQTPKSNIGEMVRENRRQVRELVNAQDATEFPNLPVQARPEPARKLRSEIPQTNSISLIV